MKLLQTAPFQKIRCQTIFQKMRCRINIFQKMRCAPDYFSKNACDIFKKQIVIFQKMRCAPDSALSFSVHWGVRAALWFTKARITEVSSS